MPDLWSNGGLQEPVLRERLEGHMQSRQGGKLVNESHIFGTSSAQYRGKAKQTQSSQNGNSETALDGVVNNRGASRAGDFTHPPLIHRVHSDENSELLHYFTANTQ